MPTASLEAVSIWTVHKLLCMHRCCMRTMQRARTRAVAARHRSARDGGRRAAGGLRLAGAVAGRKVRASLRSASPTSVAAARLRTVHPVISTST